jgi:hypothetical protein
MALNKTQVQDKIEIVNVGAYSVIQVRTATVIDEDGVELSKSFSRHMVSPADDLTNESAEVQAIATAVFTQEMKDAYTSAQETAE